MEVSSLRIFVSVANEGGISLAAEKLHYVQSNVTARIKKLEGELGAALFVRQNRGMTLTAAGHVLKGYAERILRLERQAQDAVQERINGGGSLNIGSMETSMAIRVPGVLKELHRVMPNANITVETGNTELLIKAVLNYKLDCAIVGGPLDHPDLLTQIAFKEELVLVKPKVLCNSNALLVFRQGCAYRARAEQWAREAGQQPYRVMEYGTLEGILGCVNAGLGCTLMPRSVVDRPGLRENLEVTEIPPHIAWVDSLLIRRIDTPVNGVMRQLLALMQ